MSLKPVRLELNNSGAWKVLGRFDAANEKASDAILAAAHQLAAALNDPESGRPGVCTLRISTDDGLQLVLMRWSRVVGWVAV